MTLADMLSDVQLCRGTKVVLNSHHKQHQSNWFNTTANSKRNCGHQLTSLLGSAMNTITSGRLGWMDDSESKAGRNISEYLEWGRELKNSAAAQRLSGREEHKNSNTHPHFSRWPRYDIVLSTSSAFT
jgi:hypothetical protein